ncbi:hypothetical protein TSOC_003527 [Tetrabaena socialis]|uniref:Origin recognition complex subunit 5 C-terminal domain-containing protein n=1 Tax=Tetrabaena socialis TaxID=47790 RepID=A0A2J8ABA6_9CHLO|nr:hypothetical protein TSOC_003527 [Tetrabaena socialis]|eukprot:PNH09812.1 hypothetical protein TSOC_003527 [Tetrabaena socialis]
MPGGGGRPPCPEAAGGEPTAAGASSSARVSGLSDATAAAGAARTGDCAADAPDVMAAVALARARGLRDLRTRGAKVTPHSGAAGRPAVWSQSAAVLSSVTGLQGMGLLSKYGGNDDPLDQPRYTCAIDEPLALRIAADINLILQNYLMYDK